MDYFHTDSLHVWLYAGLLLTVAALCKPREKPLACAALGAFATAAFFYFGLLQEEAVAGPFIIFFCTGAAATYLLALTSCAVRQHIGTVAYVGSNGLHKTCRGEVTCAGTIMKARLCKRAVPDALEAGTPVTIVGVAGSTLVVTPVQS